MTSLRLVGFHQACTRSHRSRQACVSGYHLNKMDVKKTSAPLLWNSSPAAPPQILSIGFRVTSHCPPPPPTSAISQKDAQFSLVYFLLIPNRKSKSPILIGSPFLSVRKIRFIKHTVHLTDLSNLVLKSFKSKHTSYQNSTQDRICTPCIYSSFQGLHKKQCQGQENSQAQADTRFTRPHSARLDNPK